MSAMPLLPRMWWRKCVTVAPDDRLAAGTPPSALLLGSQAHDVGDNIVHVVRRYDEVRHIRM
jgi:hypothetical protein